MLGDNEIKELTPINCLEGSLICQYLNNGTLIGGDYDGRLGPLTLFINNLDIVKGASILDLGSNAGHFPIEYIRSGAKTVTAIEGRKEFKTQWIKIKDQIPGIDTNKIDWLNCNVQNYIPDREHDIISCLGLAYHVEDFWPMLVRLVSLSCPQDIIFESSLVFDTKQITEIPDDRTQALKPSTVLLLDVGSMTKYMEKYFPEFGMEKIWYRFHSFPNYRGDEKTKIFTGQMRGLWILTKMN